MLHHYCFLLIKTNTYIHNDWFKHIDSCSYLYICICVLYIYIYILSSSWTVKSQKFYCLRTNSTTRLCLFVIVDYSFGQPCGFRGLFSICVCVLCTRFPLFLSLPHTAELFWSFWEMSNFVVNHFGGSDIELEAISCLTLQYNYVQHYRCFAGFCNINH